MINLRTVSNNILVIDDFLSALECHDYIKQSQAIGFKSADVDTGHGRSLLTHIRNNERVNLKSDELTALLWSRLKGIGLPMFEGKTAVALSPHLRFYKYSAGQKFNMHKDGRQNVEGKIS